MQAVEAWVPGSLASAARASPWRDRAPRRATVSVVNWIPDSAFWPFFPAWEYELHEVTRPAATPEQPVGPATAKSTRRVARIANESHLPAG